MDERAEGTEGRRTDGHRCGVMRGIGAGSYSGGDREKVFLFLLMSIAFDFILSLPEGPGRLLNWPHNCECVSMCVGSLCCPILLCNWIATVGGSQLRRSSDLQLIVIWSFCSIYDPPLFKVSLQFSYRIFIWRNKQKQTNFIYLFIYLQNSVHNVLWFHGLVVTIVEWGQHREPPLL